MDGDEHAGEPAAAAEVDPGADRAALVGQEGDHRGDQLGFQARRRGDCRRAAASMPSDGSPAIRVHALGAITLTLMSWSPANTVMACAMPIMADLAVA